MAAAAYSIPCPVTSHANDPRARYRRRASPASPRRAAKSVPPPAAAEAAAQPPPSEVAQERPPHVQAAAARWQRITDLNVRLTAILDGEGRALWLALEEALHVHWLDVAVDHYHRGYSAGRAQAWLDAALADHAEPHEKLRALSVALNDIVERLQQPPPTAAS